MFFKERKGKTFIEYTLVIGILITVLIAMTPMMRRGVQAMVKMTADQLGSQQNAEQKGGRFGQLINSTSYSEVKQDIETRERLGVVSKDYTTDQVYTQSSLYLNQGFWGK